MEGRCNLFASITVLLATASTHFAAIATLLWVIAKPNFVEILGMFLGFNKCQTIRIVLISKVARVVRSAKVYCYGKNSRLFPSVYSLRIVP